MKYKDLLKEEREMRDKTRRENLQKLVLRYGSQKALAIAITKSPSQIGNILRGVCPFGDAIKDEIEQKLDLEPGTLDRPYVDNNVQSEIHINYHKVPLYSFVQAGTPTGIGDLDFDDYVYCTSNVKGAYALRVSGDSMQPMFNEGDIVIVDPNRSPRPMDFVIAVSDLDSTSEATLKQYYEREYDEEGRTIFELRPLNKAYAIMNSAAQKLRVIGVVIELNKKF